ncbi:MAG: hypothetical protein U0412_09805 [Nitrospira sp.]
MSNLSAILAVLLLFLWGESAYSEEATRVHAADPTSSEIYGGLYLFGSLARNRPLDLGGQSLSQTEVLNGAGAGFRAGIFPSLARGVIGIQGETFGFGHELSAPPATGPNGIRSAKGTIIAGNTLISLVVRYPGEYVQPYAGAGIGLSSAHLANADLVQGTSRQTGIAGDLALAYQFFAGLRANVTSSLFLFGEYKWFSARYTWTGPLAPSLDFRSQMLAVGVGMSFH